METIDSVSHQPLRRARDGAFTLFEVVVAMAVLALLSLFIVSAQATSQTATNEAVMQERANAAAHYVMEELESADFNSLASGSSSYYYYYLQTGGGLTGVSAHFDVVAPGLPQGNQYGTIVVREPLTTPTVSANEAPWYHKGLGPKYSAGQTPTGSPNGVTVLVIQVSINIPASAGHAACRTQLTTWRFAL